MNGKVYIVGAGPGDPKLITVRGVECLRAADVVLHDRLLEPSLLEYAPPAARRIYVGKASGHHTIPQDDINRLLLRHARRGLAVVRLKGGDPFVFGRGGEEAAYLAEHGIPFEIVPGISSAIAAPAYAGIPVTHRGLSRGFAVVAGHSCTKEEPDYASLLRLAGTLVILMGVGNLERIAQQLRRGGIDPATPAAVVEQGTRAEQRTLSTTLDRLPQEAAGARPPAIIILGAVVALRDEIQWFAEQSPDSLSAAAAAFPSSWIPPTEAARLTRGRRIA